MLASLLSAAVSGPHMRGGGCSYQPVDEALGNAVSSDPPPTMDRGYPLARKGGPVTEIYRAQKAEVTNWLTVAVAASRRGKNVL
jgi:hypothetical protein